MGGGLLAQKYQPKYLREDDKTFKNLTARADNDGWIEFKAEAKLNSNNFFKDYAGSLSPAVFSMRMAMKPAIIFL